jgi:hypothetical protein
MDITFITGNPVKAETLGRMLDHPVSHRRLDLVEIQSLDLERKSLFHASRVGNSPWELFGSVPERGGPAGRDRTELVCLSYQLGPGPADSEAFTDVGGGPQPDPWIGPDDLYRPGPQPWLGSYGCFADFARLGVNLARFDRPPGRPSAAARCAPLLNPAGKFGEKCPSGKIHGTRRSRE